jgi:hypothetical protein
MTNEIFSELSLLNMDLANRTLSLDQLHDLLAGATTCIPEEVRIQYIREEGISMVQADVHVEAQGTNGGLVLQADVRIILTYQGNIVRSSAGTRQNIRKRSQTLAQQYCAKEAYKMIIDSSQQVGWG